MVRNNILGKYNIVGIELNDIILYDGKYIAKVIKIHKGYELLRIRIYFQSSLNTTVSDVSLMLCEKFNES